MLLEELCSSTFVPRMKKRAWWAYPRRQNKILKRNSSAGIQQHLVGLDLRRSRIDDARRTLGSFVECVGIRDERLMLESRYDTDARECKEVLKMRALLD